jgi:ribosome-associated protein
MLSQIESRELPPTLMNMNAHSPDDGVHIAGGPTIPHAELTWRFSKSSGPGGQSVNTSDTRAEVMFDVANSPTLREEQRRRALSRLAARLTDGVLTISSSRQRSQWQNRRAALDELSRVLAEAIAPPPRRRRPTQPTRGAIERRLRDKQRRSEIKRSRRATDD